MRTLFATLLWLCLAPPALALNVSDAYVRGLPPGQKNTAAFFVLHNPGEQAATVSAGASDAAETLEIHGHEHRDGMMRMRHKAELSIGPGETLRFAPGGLHLMLIDLKRPLRDGDTVVFTLKVDTERELTIEAPVVSVLKMNHSGHAHGEH